MGRKYVPSMTRAVKKYQDKTYKRVTVLIKKDIAELFTEHCKKNNSSMNKMINDLIKKELGVNEELERNS